ncbi:MAG: response regulator [Deltaproteobacteria bacterium]|nr:response regulator [Deltaproteobacteria bacterium]
MSDNSPKILIIDDEKDVVDTLERILLFENLKVDKTTDPLKAVEMMKNRMYDLIITDIMMPGLSGIRLLKLAKTLNPLSHVIVITGYSTVSTVYEAISKGAFEFFIKPFDDIEGFLKVVMLSLGRIERWRLLIKNKSFS